MHWWQGDEVWLQLVEGHILETFEDNSGLTSFSGNLASVVWFGLVLVGMDWFGLVTASWGAHPWNIWR